MLTNIHVLLTYICPLQCDHCFIYASPRASGKLTPTQVTHLLEQTSSIKTIEWVYFEGGEPFLVYPLLLSSVKRAKRLDFKVGIISNGYFGRSEEAAMRYLKPLIALGLDRIYISSDQFHYKNIVKSPARKVIEASIKLGLPTTRIKIGEPQSSEQDPFLNNDLFLDETRPLMMVGRAAEKIQLNPSNNDWRSFTFCPLKDLEDPESIYIDPFGNAQFCQGITLGNVWSSPIYDLMDQIDFASHPIYGPIRRNGPKGLIEEYNLAPLAEYQDACHLCYATRRQLVNRFPEYLSPPQVYNLQT